MATVNITEVPSAPSPTWLSRWSARVFTRRHSLAKSHKGRWGVVTGAGSGIGRELALQLADQGYHLWLVDVNPRTLRQTAREVRERGQLARELTYDLANPLDIERMCVEILAADQPLHLLVNNAGVAYYGPTLDMQDEQWDRILNVNLHAPARLSRRLLPRLMAQPGGQILNIASILGLVAHRKACAYNVSKFGLVGLSESLRAEFGPLGIVVTTVCPGFVDTPLFDTGMVGQPAAERRRPPRWLCTTPSHVASLALRGLAKGRRMVVVTPHAHMLFALKRFAPGVVDFVQQLERLRRKWKQRSWLTAPVAPARPSVPSPTTLPAPQASLIRAT